MGAASSQPACGGAALLCCCCCCYCRSTRCQLSPSLPSLPSSPLLQVPPYSALRGCGCSCSSPPTTLPAPPLLACRSRIALMRWSLPGMPVLLSEKKRSACNPSPKRRRPLAAARWPSASCARGRAEGAAVRRAARALSGQGTGCPHTTTSSSRRPTAAAGARPSACAPPTPHHFFSHLHTKLLLQPQLAPAAEPHTHRAPRIHHHLH